MSELAKRLTVVLVAVVSWQLAMCVEVCKKTTSGHIIETNCPSKLFKWVSQPNTWFFGSTLINGVLTLEVCQIYCEQDVTCLYVEFLAPGCQLGSRSESENTKGYLWDVYGMVCCGSKADPLPTDETISFLLPRFIFWKGAAQFLKKVHS
ncbi:hypothetical protein CRM22_004891 [Opisthorchis felineus]|uniref:Apple domain-containing protein n=1 Tax=Opisthorchis felineus TaxID=147828 RepID=A0A4S2LU21_OPIFE|nr:hypothetical protein CRM22_004891 [Opisthorchis felineus]